MTAVPMPRLKAGQEIRDLDPTTLTRIALHPLQRAAAGRVREFLAWLDQCESPGDFYEFQRHLFAAIFETEKRRAACSQAAKRRQRGKTVQADAPELPIESDPTDVATWQFEVLVCERVARQLRSVGDGLAWKAFRYDRRFIIALARNDAPGLIVNKEGLDFELGRVQELWRDKKHFALLHDLTNVIRIADLTEFTSDDGALLHEVKKTRRISAAQKARVQAAVDAITQGGDLPGASAENRLVVLSTRFRADMRPLQDAIGLARTRGMQGIALSEGRIVLVASVIDMLRLSAGNPQLTVDALAAARAGAMRRARIDRATHHLIGNSGDTAGRSPVAGPLSIFPLDPMDRADLICDLVTFETVVSVDVLAKMLRDRDLRVAVLLPERSQQVPHDADVLQIWYRDRGLVVHAPAMNPLMFELLRPSAWCDAVAESLRLATPPTHPELVLRDEAATWR